MEFVSLLCPLCGGLLPKQALWRMIACPYCGVAVTRSEDAVLAETFHKAWLASRPRLIPGMQAVSISGKLYSILSALGGGDFSEVYGALRMGPHPERVIIKRAREGSPKGKLQDEYDTLVKIQNIDAAGSAYFSRRLPQPVGIGQCDDDGRSALIFREDPGYWGSLEDVITHNKKGISPRHGVWIWRRMLEVLGYLHAQGWSHGDIRPEHLLVHPDDHGILIICWHTAEHGVKNKLCVRDLQQSAWVIRMLLAGTADKPGFGSQIPEPLINVLTLASEDHIWCKAHGAEGIDTVLKAAALEAFGPPVFVPFSPIT